MFCIGTEQGSSVKESPEYWLYLIEEVRKIYHGKITYAGNWDNYKNCTFWNKLDYIGIDAYFPVTNAANPNSQQLSEGWTKWKITSIKGENLH